MARRRPAAGDPAAGLVGTLRRRGLTVATAESLTCGLLAARLADVPGASAVLLGGVAAYDARIKTEVLGVPPDLVAVHGVVSDECARAMAGGARRLFDAGVAVSTTGVAGPGTVEGRPVGEVHVAVVDSDGRVASRGAMLHGDRPDVRSGAVDLALRMLIDAVEGPEHPAPSGC